MNHDFSILIDAFASLASVWSAPGRRPDKAELKLWFILEKKWKKILKYEKNNWN
jgi:hypothetical protein